MTKYIKDKNGKFAGSIPEDPTLETNKALSNVPPLPTSSTPAAPKNKNGIEWVVSLTLHDGTSLRGVQTAWYGHSAIDFFAKNNDVKFKTASSEKKTHFDNFLSQGLRTPLETKVENTTQTDIDTSAETPPAEASTTIPTCDYKGCDGEGTETVHWSTPVNRAGKVSPQDKTRKL